MGSNEQTILRIRCNRGLYRRFKKVAADFDSYSEALEQLLKTYELQVETKPFQAGKYQIERS